MLVHLPRGRLSELGAILGRLDRALVVSPADPDGMLAAYGLIKDLHGRTGGMEIGLTIYTEGDAGRAAQAYYRMARNVKRFLDRDLASYAWLRSDPAIRESMEEGVPLVLRRPSSEVRRDLFNVTGLLVHDMDGGAPER